MSEILKLHSLLMSGEITSEELTNKYLDAVEKENPSVNAFVNVTREKALLGARKADERIRKGENAGVLTGIPMSLKDNICTKGSETTCASKILSGYKPIYDATVWKKLESEGAVLLGKTNMDEFAMGSTCENSRFGETKNPIDTNYCAGGSSGGSAAAVSAGLSVYSLGSDTGGSVRCPASFCSAVGLKPTYGALSRYGLVAYASSLDQIGIIAQNVTDVSIVFDAVKGRDIKDSTTASIEINNTYSTLRNSIKGKKIAVVEEMLSVCDRVVLKVVKEAIKVFESLGAEIVYTKMPELKYTLPAYYIIACAEASSNLSRYDAVRFGMRVENFEDVNDMIGKVRAEGFSDEVKRRILLGTYVLSKGFGEKYYKKAVSLRHRVIRAFDELFNTCDAVLSAVSPTPPPRLFESKGVASYDSDILTTPANIASLPAVSIPASLSDEGLPIGIQLMGKKFREDEILSIAYNFEAAAGVKNPCDMGVKL